MANDDLLKEAIADAKAVKETAIANAKLALEEAFTPHLQSMLSAKLEEMDKDDDKMEEEVAEAMDDDKKVDEYGSMKKYEEDDVKKEGMHDSKKDKEVEEEIIALDEIDPNATVEVVDMNVDFDSEPTLDRFIEEDWNEKIIDDWEEPLYDDPEVNTREQQNREALIRNGTFGPNRSVTAYGNNDPKSIDKS